MNEQAAIDVQECAAEPAEYVDVFIPIYRYKDSNQWYCVRVCHTREEAMTALDGFQNMGAVKILHHVEKFVVSDQP